MNKPNNPFLISGYHSPKYFCNREKEVEKLQNALSNERNITLFSPRKLGKTGLIHHLFYRVRKEKLNLIYLDIHGTENLDQFIHQLTNAIIHSMASSRKNFFQKAIELFGKARPRFSFDQYSGMPEVSLSSQDDKEREATLKEAFQLLETLSQPNWIAIDEFQQVGQYPEANTEKALRSYIQHLNRSRFIFSGSQQHLLLPMLSDANRAFYQSTDYLELGKIDRSNYGKFINKHFEENDQTLSEDGLEYILDWTCLHTFYTQYLCNKVFAKHQQEVGVDTIKEAIREIFAEREGIYYNYRKLLSTQQYRLLKAIASEKEVSQPTSKEFIQKYRLGNASTVRKSLHALLDKELLYDYSKGETPSYQIYDVFLLRWLDWEQ